MSLWRQHIWPDRMHQLIRRFTSTSGAPITILDVSANIKDLLSRGLETHAIKLYKDQIHRLFPSHTSTPFILPSIIKACCVSQIHKPVGLQLHCDALKNGFDLECTVSNSLISMYAKFSDVQSAYGVFDGMPERDVISWCSMINCYIQNGFFWESLKMFKDMYGDGLVAKPELIASVISACVQTGNFGFGRLIHALVIVDERIENSVFLPTALVDFYFKFNDKLTAFGVFDAMEVRNEVSWTSMICECVSVNESEKALDCLRAMQVDGIKPNIVTLISLLPSCAKFNLVKHGKEIHGYAIRNEFDTDSKFSSALIHMYCDSGVESRVPKLIFDRSSRKDVVIWSCLIAFYSRSKHNAGEALRLFNVMQQEGIQPNDVTLLALISASINMLSVGHGRAVHGYAVKAGLLSELPVQNSFISMYAKCGFLKDSIQMFTEMTTKDSVSWTAITSAYGHYGYGEDALLLFNEMTKNGMKVDAIAVLELITVCNHAGFVEVGQELFKEAMKDKNISLTLEHYACYIDMLGRAGKLEDALDIVIHMPLQPSERIWSALISACKLYGKLELAEKLAHRLIKLEPENAANYTLLSMIYGESDNWIGVEEVRKSMKERKIFKDSGFSSIS